ncbi:MAG: hypothetical protein H7A23_20755 [Leptospiraceae bacterium]|nr:hypothetical protein [Leptospiraceae bacterium]
MKKLIIICKKIILYGFASLSIAVSGLILVACMKQKSPTFFPIALLGSKVEPYTYEDIGLTPENQAPDKEVTDTREPSIPLMSDTERAFIKSVMQEMDDIGIMTEEAFAESSRTGMKAMSEKLPNDVELDEIIDNTLEDKPVPERPKVSKEEVLRRESAAADRYYNSLREKFPELSKEELIQLRINITLGLVIVRMQKDYNPPDGIPNEVLDMAKDKAVKFRQVINTELVKRGVTSL